MSISQKKTKQIGDLFREKKIILLKKSKIGKSQSIYGMETIDISFNMKTWEKRK
jgi:hypothetical protein